MFSSNTSAVSADAVFVEDVMSTTLYTGNGSTQTITNGIDLAGQGGLVWLKNRNSTQLHWLFDTARGKDSPLSSTNSDSVSTNVSNYFGGSNLCVFNSNGFTANGGQAQLGTNGNTYASWTFRKQPKFFDVVTYTGNGVATGRAITHSLGSAPGFIIIKRTDTSSNWIAWHKGGAGTESYLYLNSQAASPQFAGGTVTDSYNGSPSTQFIVYGDQFLSGGNVTDVNASGGTYVAYLFAHNAGGFGLTGTDNVISCGSYTGTGAAGNAITLGYEPQWVLIKRTDSTGNWGMTDTMRGMSVTNNAVLYSNLSNAELDAGSPIVYPTATGFTCGTGSAGWNASGGTYIYIAIRRGPMKTPTTGTSVFSPTTASSEPQSTPLLTGGSFPSDMVLHRPRYTLTGYGFYNTGRLTGGGTSTLETFSTVAAYDFGSPPYWKFDNSTAAYIPANGYFNNNGEGSIGYALYSFRRAPGFFDVVCYTGTGSARTINHNLGVVPEMMIVKARSGATAWFVYTASTGNQGYTMLQSNAAFYNPGSSNPWNSTTPTASVFSLVGTGWNVNDSGTTYVNYLFASCPGVSKVTNFTGTGTLQTINCGFTGGARLVLIKRTDASGDWYIWDSSRGLSSSNDPYLLLNSTAAEVTTTNWVDTTSTGFQVTAAAGNNVNINGASYIALAIA